MKRLIFLFLILAAACTQDSEVKAPIIPDDPTMMDIYRDLDTPRDTPSGRIQALCPDYHSWTMQATTSYNCTNIPNNGGYCIVQYAMTPRVDIYNQTKGCLAGTFTFQITNTGNVALEYMYNSSVGYLPLAIGASATFSTNFVGKACGGYPPTVTNKLYTKLVDCAYPSTTNMYHDVQLIGVSGGHSIGTNQFNNTWLYRTQPACTF